MNVYWQDCHSNCVKKKKKTHGGFENAEAVESGLLEEEETKEREKECEAKEKRESGQRGTEREPSLLPASAFWKAACWMIGLKSLLTWPLCSILILTRHTLPSEIGHSIHNMQHVKQGSVTPIISSQSGSWGEFWIQLTKDALVAVLMPILLQRGHVVVHYYPPAASTQTWYYAIVSHDFNVRFCHKHPQSAALLFVCPSAADGTEGKVGCWSSNREHGRRWQRSWEDRGPPSQCE